MELRPCIDIHNGKVKQLVGGSIQDQGDSAQENYISSQDAAWYARLFQEKGLKNGHVILLNSKDSAYYEQTRQQALSALQAYPGGLQVGGGITAENAREYLDAGASHVIVTSYVFRNGDISFENLNRMMDTVGKKRLVLDLSCRKKDGKYYIVTDRWQTYTRVALSEEILTMLSSFCDEFLIHGVDVEGKRSGIEQELIGCWEDGIGFRSPTPEVSAVWKISNRFEKPDRIKFMSQSAARWTCMAETCRLKKCWRRVNSNDVEAQFTCAICKIPSWMLPAVLQEGIEKISNWGLTF